MSFTIGIFMTSCRVTDCSSLLTLLYRSIAKPAAVIAYQELVHYLSVAPTILSLLLSQKNRSAQK